MYSLSSSSSSLSLLSLSLSLYSGGINYTIAGNNLNSVQEPRLLVYYDGAPEASGNRNKRQIMQERRFKSEVCLQILVLATRYVLNKILEITSHV